jgi:hypothetical protein
MVDEVVSSLFDWDSATGRTARSMAFRLPRSKPFCQPIQARKSIRMVRLRPKVRQTAPLLVPLTGSGERPARENRDGFHR